MGACSAELLTSCRGWMHDVGPLHLINSCSTLSAVPQMWASGLCITHKHIFFKWVRLKCLDSLLHAHAAAPTWLQLKHSSHAMACCQMHSRAQLQIAAPLPYIRDLAKPAGPVQAGMPAVA